MPAQLSGLVDSLQKTIRQFTLAQRTLAILAVAVLALGAFGLAAWLTKPTMTPLFSGVSASDASAIVDKLAEDGVTYELSDGGSTILVPADAVYSERLAMASAGLPAASDGQGYSLLDSMGMTSSEFQQQVTGKNPGRDPQAAPLFRTGDSVLDRVFNQWLQQQAGDQSL